jgi:hypothetical protein
MMTLTPFSHNLAGESRQLALNFYKIRSLFFHFGSEFDLTKIADVPIEAGIGYTFTLPNFKVDACINEGLYLFWWPFVYTPWLNRYVALNNFQEAYLDFPFRRIPFSVKVGFRNTYFGVYDDANGDHFLALRSQVFSLLGFDYIFAKRLAKQRIFFTWARNASSGPYLSNQFCLGYGIDLYTAKKKK